MTSFHPAWYRFKKFKHNLTSSRFVNGFGNATCQHYLVFNKAPSPGFFPLCIAYVAFELDLYHFVGVRYRREHALSAAFTADMSPSQGSCPTPCTLHPGFAADGVKNYLCPKDLEDSLAAGYLRRLHWTVQCVWCWQLRCKRNHYKYFFASLMEASVSSWSVNNSIVICATLTLLK